jgi:hypothetical protein
VVHQQQQQQQQQPNQFSRSLMIELATAKSIIPEHDEYAPSTPRFVCSRVDVYFSCLAFVASISFSIIKFYLLENDEYASSTLLFEVRRVTRVLLGHIAVCTLQSHMHLFHQAVAQNVFDSFSKTIRIAAVFPLVRFAN